MHSSVASALLVDLYEFTMADAYLATDRADRPAVFSLAARHLPPRWGYLIAAGLDSVLQDLEIFTSGRMNLAYLDGLRMFSQPLLERLASLRFSGSVWAVAEGTPVFPLEPLLEVEAPMIEAQLLESMVLNRVHVATLLASKASRSVEAAAGRTLVEFGLRRAHGADAALVAARSSYLAGFDATSNVLAGRRFDIPLAGTMAHSFIEAFPNELTALRAFAGVFPAATLLVDTYDTATGVQGAIRVGKELVERGATLGGVRLDSGDTLALSMEARGLLDDAGFPEAKIFVSGNLDEYEIARLLSRGAPIDGFGVGTRMDVSADMPYLDVAYKLVSFDGHGTMKLSSGKATLPGAKQVWRVDGHAMHDLIGMRSEDARVDGTALLSEVMVDGRAIVRPTLRDARDLCRAERDRLPSTVRTLDATSYDVRISQPLAALRRKIASEVG